MTKMKQNFAFDKFCDNSARMLYIIYSNFREILFEAIFCGSEVCEILETNSVTTLCTFIHHVA
jgi:hypothetical protein